jgi:two-component system chemotaxis response regulator CheB
MPEMDGLQTLVALRKTHPRLPVIMFSTLTERGAAVTLDALMRGANDYVTKPSNVGSVQEAMERVRSQLVPKIRALCGLDRPGVPARPSRAALPARPSAGPSAGPTGPSSPSSGRLARPAAPSPARPGAPAARPLHDGPPNRVDAVVIGVSTGGPNALAEVLPTLPGSLRVPVLVVQHMPPVFTGLLAERLNTHAALHVGEAKGNETVAAGDVWLAPGDFHLEVERRANRLGLRLHQGPPENSCRPAADVLFRSAVKVWGGNVLAVVLTGMGQDGLRGCEEIRAAGGRVFAQDEPSSVVWGMPGAVVRAGLANKVLPLQRIGPEIASAVAAMAGAR